MAESDARAEVTAPTSKDQRKHTRLVVLSGSIGQFVEFYDFVVYAYLSTTIAKLFFPSNSELSGILIVFGVYAVGFAARPLGAVVFSHLGDRHGRRGVMTAILMCMGLSTLAIGLLPTHASIGAAAGVLVIIFRLVQGFSAGAEATGSNAQVAEHAPANRRGFLVSCTYTFATIAPVVVALVVLVVTNIMSPESFESWGWRIPFLLGGVISIAGILVRRQLKESPAYLAAKSRETPHKEKVPAAEVFQGYLRPLAFVFLVAASAGLGYYLLTGFMVTYMKTSVGLTSNQALISNSIALLVGFVAAPIFALISDTVGRKPVVLTGIALVALSSVPCFMLISSGSLGSAIAGQTLFVLASSVFAGPVGILYLELFPTRVRFTGAAIGLNAAYVVFSGTAPFVSTWLVEAAGTVLAPSFYTATLALIVFVACIWMPETSKRSLTDDAAFAKQAVRPASPVVS